LNNGKFSIVAKILDTSKQKLVFMHAGGGTGKYGYWRPWTSTSLALSLPNISKASAEKQTSK
jgi:hypothetical protein